MADIFLGELLIFLLLVPLLLRPFSRRIQRIQSIPVLAPAALFCLLFLVWGQGVSVSILCTAIPVIVIFLSVLPSLIRFLSGLPTDWFGGGTKIYTVFLMILTIFCATTVFLWMPDTEAMQESVAVQSISISGTFASGFTASSSIRDNRTGSVYVWAPVQNTEPAQTVFYLPDAQAGARDCRITAQLLAEKGYIVVAADFYKTSYMREGFYNFIVRPFAVRMSNIFPRLFQTMPDDEIIREKIKELTALIDFWESADSEGKNVLGYTLFAPDSTDFFILAEGRAAAAADVYKMLNKGKISGTCYLLANTESEKKADDVMPSVPEKEAVLQLQFRRSGIPAGAGQYDSAQIFGAQKELFGYGNIRILYPADAALLGTTTDTESSSARLAASLSGEYFSRRRGFLAENSSYTGVIQ